jgi:hypothetical protein
MAGMTELKVTVEGLGEVITFNGEFMNRVYEEMPHLMREIAEEAQKEIQAEAPRWHGYLGESIYVRFRYRNKTGAGFEVSSAAPYAEAQERGFTPHFVPADYPTKGKPGETIRDWMNEKGISGPGITVSTFQPFMGRGFEQGARNLRVHLEQTMVDLLKTKKIGK